MHHHHAVQLVVSLDNPYNAVLDHQDIKSVRGFLIDSDVPHACQSADSTALVISVDATSAKGRMLKQQLSKRTFALIDEFFSMEAINHFLADYWRYCLNAENEFDPLYLVYQLSNGQNDVTLFDMRLLAAIEPIMQVSQTMPTSHAHSNACLGFLLLYF